jgi:hypothetical protein
MPIWLKRRVVLSAVCLLLAAMLGSILGTALRRGPAADVGLPSGDGLAASAASLRGTVYCEKAQRLAL